MSYTCTSRFNNRRNRFIFQVTVTAQSPTLPAPDDWVLIASGIDNIATVDTTCALVFTDNSAQVEVITNPENLNRIDVNGDDRADQLELRILLRYLSGLHGTELAEQEVVEDIIRLLLDRLP